MRWMTEALGVLWRIARGSRVDVGLGLRPGSGASALYLFLFLVFLLAGLVLVLLGVDLDDADRWLDRQAGWLDLLGGLALRTVFGLVLLACAGVLVDGIWSRLAAGRTQGATARRHLRRGGTERTGWGGMIVAVVLGYFAAIGAFGR